MLKIVGNRLLFEDGQQHLIIDFEDFFANKSRIALNRLDEDSFVIVSDIIKGLTEKAVLSGASGYVQDIQLLGLLMLRHLVRISKPVKVLEIGCAGGKVSSILGFLLGQYSPESFLCCVSDRTDMEWENQMSAVEKLPKLSYLASDFEFTNLQSQSFDIILLNGFTTFLDPHPVIKEALRLLNQEGIFLIYADHSPLLNSLPGLYFEKRERYEITPSRVIWLMQGGDCSWSGKEDSELYRIDAILGNIEAALENPKLLEAYSEEYVRELDTYIKSANQEYDFCMKECLLELKEKVLEAAISKNGEYSTCYLCWLKEELEKSRAVLERRKRGSGK